MKFIKALGNDLNLLKGRWPFHVLLTGLYAVVIFFVFFFDLFHNFYGEITRLSQVNSLHYSTGDILMCEFGKMPPISVTESIEFPTGWFLTILIILYFIVQMIPVDLSQEGIQVLTRIHSPAAWWLSKCLMALLSVALYFGSFIAVLFLSTALAHAETGLQWNTRIFERYFNVTPISVNSTLADKGITYFITPWLVMAAVSIGMMTLTLFVKPMIAYFIASAYLIAGIYVLHPLLLSSYAMPCRSSIAGVYQFNSIHGMIVSVVMMAVSVLVGLRRINSYDFLALDSER